MQPIIQLSIIGAAFGAGIFATFAILAVMRPSTYDDAWRDGYDAGKEDALDTPAIWRRKKVTGSAGVAGAAENDVAAEAAIAGWAEELKAAGEVRISKVDLAACYPVPVAPMAELVAWIKREFPRQNIVLQEDAVTIRKSEG